VYFVVEIPWNSPDAKKLLKILLDEENEEKEERPQLIFFQNCFPRQKVK
jgi:hypothetical protein